MSFQKDFIWGAATASYQIEGAYGEDGKGESIWDEFSRVPGATFEGHTGETACDHYHRFKEDIALLNMLGIKAYRFSFSWPRILPQGTGEVNEAGIRFYEDMLEELAKNGITPYATLFHWDYPSALQKKGGWLNPESPVWFERYAEVIAKRFRGKIKNYFTINEPQCFIGLGHGNGVHAPGLKLSAKDNFLAVHNVLLAHGRAVAALRKYGGSDLQIGLAQCGRIRFPLTDSAEDIEAAKKATFAVPNTCFDAIFSVALWSDPIFKGEYPKEYLEKFKELLPEIGADDMKIISQPIDFYAQNIYNGQFVQADASGWKDVNFPVGMTKTAIGWPVTPDCMYWCARFIYDNYGKPIIISENGMSAHDAVSLDGKVHDPNRVDFMNRYLLSLRKAAAEGVPLKGYFAWTFLDNFEWACGYNDRFGLIYVDYQTQRRIPKDSAYWYKDIIASNGEIL
jgi:beta-glucosidase